MILYTEERKNKSDPLQMERVALVCVCEQRGKRESREEVGLSFLPDMLIIHEKPLLLVNGL